jgi:tRNA threonylcarbamoyladenosine biosynthesis protein TsaB
VLNLAFDTATRWGRFALAQGSQLCGYLPVNVTGSYADQLLPVIQLLLQGAGHSLADVQAIGVTRGPGSFTGVRIGVATAKSLAYSLGVRLVAVSTLAAMAAALLNEQPDRQLAVPVLDARRGEVFAALYRRSDGWVEAVAEPAALPPDAWWERLGSLLSDWEAPVWGGDGVSLLLGQGAQLRAELRARGEPRPRPWVAAHAATAKALALAMGKPGTHLPEFHPFALTPLYLRASDAELKRGLDLTPGRPHDQRPWPPRQGPKDVL